MNLLDVLYLNPKTRRSPRNANGKKVIYIKTIKINIITTLETIPTLIVVPR